jgi:hypothetical protein
MNPSVNEWVRVTQLYAENFRRVGQVILIDPPSNGCPTLYLVRFSDGSEFPYDRGQIKVVS